MDLARIYDTTYRDSVEHVRQAADMVFVRMRRYQNVQVFDPELTKTGGKARPR